MVWFFEAAEYLASPSLVAILETYGPDDVPVAYAVAACPAPRSRAGAQFSSSA